MHEEIGLRIDGLLEGETDWVAAMATVKTKPQRQFYFFPTNRLTH